MTGPKTVVRPAGPSRVPPVSSGAVEALRAKLHGRLVTPEDEDYDEVRAVWNAMIDRRPRWIARCAGPADVARCVAFAFAAGEEATRPFRNLGHVVGEHVGPAPFKLFQRSFDPLLTSGARNYWKSHNFTELADGLLEVLLKAAPRLPSTACELFLAHMGGATNRVPPGATAYPHRDVAFILNVHARWEGASDDRACRGWARSVFDAAAPYATGGVYVNFMPDDEEDRLGSAFGANRRRLAQVKQAYDPTDLFSLGWTTDGA
jgi:hypothetical protein